MGFSGDVSNVLMSDFTRLSYTENGVDMLLYRMNCGVSRRLKGVSVVL